MKLPPLEYTIDNIVLGWREEAVSFAAEHNYHLIVNSDQREHYYFQREDDIKHKWFEGIFQLGMKSLLPIPFEIQTVGFEDEKLKVITKGNTKVLINFGKLHIFDLDNFTNLNVEEIVEDYTVYDFFDITAGAKQINRPIVEFENTFVKTATFVPTNRSDRDKSGATLKDILVKSHIQSEDIKSFDFSETVVRLLLMRRLKELEIRAVPTKHQKESKFKKNRNIKVSHSYRHVSKNKFHYNIIDELDDRIALYG
ncbi:hypothetical protein CMI37_23535 [Candidatus Pacearchaeota archaeon]|nr:hypothetical protein [Candidatus Pacearchaeota archaeon]